MNRFFRFAAVASLAALSVTAAAQDKPLKVGVTAGPHAQVFEAVKKAAERDGLKVEIIEFSDFVQPNAALAAGDLNANSYQHLPYLEAQINDRGYKFVSVGYTVTFPMGIYSKKVKSLKDVAEGARVGIPNDPTNGGRGLLLLQAEGLLKLKPDAGLKATPLDIAENPKKLKIVELDAAQLPRALGDLDIAAVNGNYAETAGLDPAKEAISLEGPQGPYACVIVVREEDRDKPWVAQLLKAYHSDEVKQFIRATFKESSVIPSW
ncbi:MAG: MetQ/NlpA family ABC transporter substrate-binding protein [Candidatus Accumulibacter sp.]|jgi:D-methionine transport system substrate-binding protein|nr:MetQ/NlpA family ABC transporter substrate-binding protein [Accumulibacter sp.]